MADKQLTIDTFLLLREMDSPTFFIREKRSDPLGLILLAIWFRSFEGNNGTNPGDFVDLLVTQTIGTLVSGNSYDFSADVKLEDNHRSDSIIATLDGDLNIDLKSGVNPDSTWQTVSGSFTYTGGPDLLSLVFTNGSDSGTNPQSAFVDNVSIVPEPSSVMLMGLGVVGLLSRRRR